MLGRRCGPLVALGDRAIGAAMVDKGGSAGLDAHHEHLSEHEQVVSCLDHPFDTAVD
jgi:hypothetical protein